MSGRPGQARTANEREALLLDIQQFPRLVDRRARARALGVGWATACRWWARYRDQGLAGLEDGRRRGRAGLEVRLGALERRVELLEQVGGPRS